MVLGLGVSHRPVNAVIEIAMTSPVEALRSYATEVANWLKGDGPATLCQRFRRFIRCRSISAP